MVSVHRYNRSELLLSKNLNFSHHGLGSRVVVSQGSTNPSRIRKPAAWWAVLKSTPALLCTLHPFSVYESVRSVSRTSITDPCSHLWHLQTRTVTEPGHWWFIHVDRELQISSAAQSFGQEKDWRWCANSTNPIIISLAVAKRLKPSRLDVKVTASNPATSDQLPRLGALCWSRALPKNHGSRRQKKTFFREEVFDLFHTINITTWVEPDSLSSAL